MVLLMVPMWFVVFGGPQSVPDRSVVLRPVVFRSSPDCSVVFSSVMSCYVDFRALPRCCGPFRGVAERYVVLPAVSQC